MPVAARADRRPSVILAVASLIMLLTVPLGAQDRATTELRGRVTDTQGSPIGGARVEAAGAAGGTITGADGRYRLHLSDPSARIRVAALGYESAEVAAAGGEIDGSTVIVLERAPHELPGVTVTGLTRGEIARVPGATAVVTSAMIHGRAPLSVMDALRTVPGIQTADEDPYGLNLNIGFRGLPPRRSSRTLLLEDGVPILLGPYGDPSMHYAPPVEALERVEIIKGSGQIMNGPQTVGGVVNFVTRRPPDEGVHGSVTLGGGELGYRNGHAWIGAGKNGSGIAFDLTYREGEGVRREHAHEVRNALVTGVLAVTDAQSLVIKGGLWNEDSRISETGLTQAEFEEDPFSLPFSAHGRFDVRRYLAQVVHEIRHGAMRLQTNAYVSNTERASWRQSGESEERLGEEGFSEDFNCAPEATSYAQCGNQGRPRTYAVIGLEPRLSLRFGDGRANDLEVGARLYREDVRRRQFLGNTPTSREPDADLTRDNEIDTRVAAAFAQARIRLGAATLSPGLRVERLAQEIANRFPGSEASVRQAYAQLLPGIGGTYEVKSGATLFAGVHRGFAPPRPADVYDPEPGQPVVLVDPETSWNWEAGTRIEPVPGASAEATVFRMDFGNQIIEAPASVGQRFTNGGETLHQGLELSGLVSLGTLRRTADDLTLRGSYTYLPVARFEGGDGRGEEVAGNRLPYAARHLASASATFAHRSGVTVGAALEHTGDQFADDENTRDPTADGQSGILPAYTVTHAFLSYALPGTRLQLRASVRNLFDEVYITQRNEGIYTGMRRLVRTEVGWEF